MKIFTLNLKDYFDLKTLQSPTLDCYLIDPDNETDPNKKHPSILILPGGGYFFTSSREAEPIALDYLAMGFNAFVLKYSIAPEKYPQALLEASAAMTLIRNNSEEWFVDKEKIAVIGFSAGGHLAGCLGTIWDEDVITETLGIKKDYNKPNAVLLSYPVITSDERYSHKGSFVNILGDDAPSDMFEKLSLEKRVTKDTPPTFIWHTANDKCVPVINSILFAKALAENDVPFELHIFPDGPHGLANCNITTAKSKDDIAINPYCERWIQLSQKWLLEVCKF